MNWTYTLTYTSGSSVVYVSDITDTTNWDAVNWGIDSKLVKVDRTNDGQTVTVWTRGKTASGPERVSEPGDTWRFFLTFKDGSTYLDTISISTDAAQRADMLAMNSPQDFVNTLNPEGDHESVAAWTQPVAKIQRVRERDGYTWLVWPAKRASGGIASEVPGWVPGAVAAAAIIGAFGFGMWFLGNDPKKFGIVKEIPDHLKVWMSPSRPEANWLELQKTLDGFGVNVLEAKPYGSENGQLLTLRGKVSPRRLNLIGDVCGFDTKYVITAYAPEKGG